jgi:hypothetical protein
MFSFGETLLEEKKTGNLLRSGRRSVASFSPCHTCLFWSNRATLLFTLGSLTVYVPDIMDEAYFAQQKLDLERRHQARLRDMELERKQNIQAVKASTAEHLVSILFGPDAPQEIKSKNDADNRDLEPILAKILDASDYYQVLGLKRYPFVTLGGASKVT